MHTHYIHFKSTKIHIKTPKNLRLHLDDWLTVLHRSINLVGFQLDAKNSYLFTYNTFINTLRTGSFKLFKRPLQGFLTILTL